MMNKMNKDGATIISIKGDNKEEVIEQLKALGLSDAVKKQILSEIDEGLRCGVVALNDEAEKESGGFTSETLDELMLDGFEELESVIISLQVALTLKGLLVGERDDFCTPSTVKKATVDGIMGVSVSFLKNEILPSIFEKGDTVTTKIINDTIKCAKQNNVDFAIAFGEVYGGKFGVKRDNDETL